MTMGWETGIVSSVPPEARRGHQTSQIPPVGVNVSPRASSAYTALGPTFEACPDHTGMARIWFPLSIARSSFQRRKGVGHLLPQYKWAQGHMQQDPILTVQDHKSNSSYVWTAREGDAVLPCDLAAKTPGEFFSSHPIFQGTYSAILWDPVPQNFIYGRSAFPLKQEEM